MHCAVISAVTGPLSFNSKLLQIIMHSVWTRNFIAKMSGSYDETIGKDEKDDAGNTFLTY